MQAMRPKNQIFKQTICSGGGGNYTDHDRVGEARRARSLQQAAVTSRPA